MDVDEAFADVLRRQPSEGERQRNYGDRNAFGLRDNDAFWDFVMLLDHYDSFCRHDARQIAKRARGTIEAAREASVVAAAGESAKAGIESRTDERGESPEGLAERPVEPSRLGSG